MNQERSVTRNSLAQGGLHKSRRAHALGTTGLALMLAVALGGVALAQSAPVSVPDKSFPESVTSTKDGTLYAGSFNLGGVVKASPGGKTVQFIQPGANGSRSTLGVLADEKSGTLYACSNDLSGLGVKGPSDAKGSVLKTFDLKTGADKGSFALGEGPSLCNDIVVGGDGTAYITDSLAPNIYALKPGATKLEIWATDPAFTPAQTSALVSRMQPILSFSIATETSAFFTANVPPKPQHSSERGSSTKRRPRTARSSAIGCPRTCSERSA